MRRKTKQSGIEWIGDIPEEWDVIRNKYLMSVRSEKNHPAETVLSLYRDYGVIPKNSRSDNHNVTSEDTSGYKFVREGDFVVNKMKAWQGSMALSKYQGIVSPAYHVYEIESDEVIPEYLHHLLRSAPYASEFRKLSTGLRVGQWDLSTEAFLNTLVLLPPKEEQLAIACYIDEKHREIDNAIAAAEASIEEYKQYQKALIFETVTKGLDETAPTKNCELDWIEAVPSHWDVVQQKYLMRKKKVICDCWSGQDVLSLTTGGVIVRDLDNPKGKMPTTFDGYQYVEKGNLLMCLFDIDVTPRCVGLVENDGVTSPAYSQFVMINGASARYYDYYLRAIDDQKLYLHLTSTMRHSFTPDSFGAIKALCPPLREQIAIADYLDEKCAGVQRAISSKLSIVEELKAYKKALIFEVVTGKREVA